MPPSMLPFLLSRNARGIAMVMLNLSCNGKVTKLYSQGFVNVTDFYTLLNDVE
jgi:hypothetical protein